MAAQAVYTASQRARAASLLEGSKTWTRGRRKADGLAFVIFPSTKTGRVYYSSQLGCTCSGYLYRGACSHVLALQTEAQRAQNAPRKRYEEPFNDDLGAF